jgi:predicted RNA binding protein YcfA (HicA-like mRNA interferase family)
MKVRDVLKRLQDDGWYQIRMKGSHRVLSHPSKPGIVVVPGNPGDDIHQVPWQLSGDKQD